jgi:thioredoxin/thiamine biosynthesis protein ThiS
MSVKITSDNFDAEILESSVLVLADFYSNSCLPCKRLSPVLAELEEEYGERLKLCKISADINQELCETYHVLSAPTLLFFKGGVLQERRSGFVGKDALREIINQMLMEGKMKLTVTGKEKEYEAGITVSQLIELEQVETPQYVTVSVNDEFVPSGSFAETKLRDGDNVEFLYFMGGGR